MKSEYGEGSTEQERQTLPANAAEPLVSILIPAYNAQRWIADTLRSALAQQWGRKEIIVVDDGSSDNTPRIVRQFESQGVRLIEQKNQGAAAARNTALSASSGEYIAWLDADDLLAPDKISAQMARAKELGDKRALLASPWGIFMYRPETARFVPTSLWHDLTPAEWLTRKLAENIYMQTGAWLISRELSDAIGPWEVAMSSDDDGEYFCRALLACSRVVFVPCGGVYYRKLGASGVSYLGRSPEKLTALWVSMQRHINGLRSLEDSPRVRSACCQYIRTALPEFYPEQPEIVRQALQVASELGETLALPRLSWKYSWIQLLFGWRAAKAAQQLAREGRWALQRNFARVLARS